MQPEAAEKLLTEADSIEYTAQLSGSFAGQLGKFFEPAFAPLGYDWKLTVGVLTSFAAREVFVSTLAVLTAGDDDVENAVAIADAIALKFFGSSFSKILRFLLKGPGFGF